MWIVKWLLEKFSEKMWPGVDQQSIVLEWQRLTFGFVELCDVSFDVERTGITACFQRLYMTHGPFPNSQITTSPCLIKPSVTDMWWNSLSLASNDTSLRYHNVDKMIVARRFFESRYRILECKTEESRPFAVVKNKYTIMRYSFVL